MKKRRHPRDRRRRKTVKRAVPKTKKPYLKRLEDMTEPELAIHFRDVLDAVEARQPDDVLGSMVITFMENTITQYVASIDPETAPAALRELATRLEQRETVKR